MGNFNRGGDREGPRGGFRPRDREVSMHRAVCSNCGQNCEVPFRPTGDKPVYCNNCFVKRQATGGDGGGRGGERYPRRDFGGGGEPRQNFDGARGGGNADIVRQLEALNTKLDRLIRIVEKPVQAVEKPTETRETKDAKQGTLKQAVKRAVDAKKKK